MRKILILPILIMSLSICSYAEEVDINIQSEVIDIESEPFDNDVTIILSNFKRTTIGPTVRYNKFAIRDTVILDSGDLTNVVADLKKGTEVTVVESKEDYTKIIYNDDYYYTLTNDLGYETQIEEDVVEYPYHESVPLAEDLQKYIYDKCVASGIKYCLFLGLCQQETDFGRYGKVDGVRFHNVSKTADYGMCQTNKKYVWPDVRKVFGWDDIHVLFDPYRSVDAGIWEFSKCVAKYGNTEAAYDAYNRGLEHHGSTKNSRAVVRYWNHWISILGDI